MKTKQDINSWLRQQAYSPETVKLYRYHLIELLRWLKGHQVSFEAMGVDDFLSFLDEKDWGASMRRLSLCAARAYARDNVGRDHPVFVAKVRRPTDKPQRTLTVEEVRRVLDTIDIDTPNGIRDYAMICLLVDTGLRVSEACRLRIVNMDLDKCVLNVRVKGGDHRYAAFTEFTASALLDWLVIREEYSRPDCDRVFVGVYGHTPGGRMTSGGIRALFRRLAKRSGVSHFSPHAFRRTMATLMTAVNQAPERVTQIGGGWHDGKMVKVYTQAMDIESTRPYLAMRAVNPPGDTPLPSQDLE